MSSPIHQFLFSPPPPPPTLKRANRPPPLTSLHALLPEVILPRVAFDGSSELKPRSPRTPQQQHATAFLDYLGSDNEATPRAAEIFTPRRKVEKTVFSPPYLPTNVPSTQLPLPSTLPRPLLRLILLASLIASSILLLLFVPSVRLPSLYTASIGRHLALAPDGRAALDVANAVRGWEKATERVYEPPQIKTANMMKRSAPRLEERRAAREWNI